eukprot:CAMPEP_0178957064 /NCGR_PEP_ID=MMETSP0789-20121207/10671_1 /TAXON_ID=3005 /ORGANISM="Rhizosolenia setigera, Strain CCMP 1694" /LENGTH=110 /DNA_ID=CAMNT_0020639201 /DNA_START=64 /DNA_END=396 /DNA_ORIENTATION=+
MTLENSVNLARRLSVQNENDLMQETYVRYSKSECEKMILALSGKISKLPMECRYYVGRPTKKPAESKTEGEHVDPFAGMYSGQRNAAAAERARGRPTQAVLQRRYTKARS